MSGEQVTEVEGAGEECAQPKHRKGFVPHGALHKVRQRRKESDERLRTLKAQLCSLKDVSA